MARSGTTTSRPASAGITDSLADDLAALMCALHDLVDPYRREAHYMRGPGPKWRARHAADGNGPAVTVAGRQKDQP